MSSQRSSRKPSDATGPRSHADQTRPPSKLSLARSYSSEEESASGEQGSNTFSPLPTLLRRDSDTRDSPSFSNYLPKRGSFNLPVAPDSAATSSLRSNADPDASPPQKLRAPPEDSSTLRRELSLEEDSDPEDRPAPGYESGSLSHSEPEDGDARRDDESDSVAEETNAQNTQRRGLIREPIDSNAGSRVRRSSSAGLRSLGDSASHIRRSSSSHTNHTHSFSNGHQGSNSYKRWFCSLPQPSDARVYDHHISDSYIRSLQENIETLQSHITALQAEETSLTNEFREQLESFDPKAKDSSRQDHIRDAYTNEVVRIREARRQYRALLYDAMAERNKLLRAGELEHFRKKNIADMEQRLHPARTVDWFVVFFFIMQIAIFLLYLIFVNFATNGTLLTSNPALGDDIFVIYGSKYASDTNYSLYIHMTVFAFLGLGLFFTLPRRSTWSALGFNLLIGACAFEIAVLLNGFYSWAHSGGTRKIYLTPVSMIEGMYAVTACMISYGAVVGQLSAVGLFVMTLFEVSAYCTNYFVTAGVIGGKEFGRAAMVHMFGAAFGVGLAWTLSFLRTSSELLKEHSPSYFSSLTATLGSLLLMILFPSFNNTTSQYWTVSRVFSQGPYDNSLAIHQYRALINTIVSTMGSAVVGIILSKIWRGKLRWADLQCCLVAGGVAMGSAHSILIQPWAAMLIGGVTGIWSFAGLVLVQPFLFSKLGCNDVRNVFSTFFMPSCVGAVAGMIALAMYADATYRNFGGQDLGQFFTQKDNALRNFGSFIISFVLGLGSGLIGGFFLNGFKKVIPPPLEHERLTDEAGWRLGVDFM